jgi:hypothetical protein
MNKEREERQKRHLQAMHEYLIAEYRDDIVEYQQSMDEAAARGNEYARRTYEQMLADAKEGLAREEARRLPV